MAQRYLIIASILLASSYAQAHIALESPVSRDPGGKAQTKPPCGGLAASATPTQLQAGAQLNVTWKNQIAHPGHYRISLAADPNTFTSNILMDNIASPDSTADQNQSVTLPTTACSPCVLQLVQVNTSGKDSTTFSKYVEYVGCADVSVVVGSGTSSTSTGGGTSTSTGGTEGTSTGGTTSASEANEPANANNSGDGNMPTGGCAAAGVSIWALAGVAGALLRQRRNQQG